MSRPVLEPSARAFAEATARPPYLCDLPLEAGRRALAEVQLPDLRVPGVTRQPVEGTKLTVFRPEPATGSLPVVLYLHDDWVFGGEPAHGRLARELARESGAATVFLDYGLSPESRHPGALDEGKAALDWIAVHGGAHGLDATRVAVAGGNLAAALALTARERLAAQVLLCPATDASCDTGSYGEFAEGYFLRADGMRWRWEQYLADQAQRTEITVSPLLAAPDRLAGLPPTLIVVAEADVLRDEGEAYAARLRAAGVPVTAVRYQGVIHGFLTLNALRGTQAAQAAIDQAGRFLARALLGRAGPAA
ncbi:alpha/beta hydrolase [Nonomuraea gerenzanensis]|uniref:Esterase/lipase/thioesterase n=1 Tax=Nonomuraea gerenzanensis TaxID=93944 RepID=A0A1M4ECW4_9ACTN|nr:alpha/beta hydrolase [Nonomuraea gerenzanensis]UBU08317.1 alpha/beta hydrolase [Nonomuraea gerenzanensis]SBO96650.1 Esterase/lipase/thioesterase [Nonomuraea gerenzanensis]